MHDLLGRFWAVLSGEWVTITDDSFLSNHVRARYDHGDAVSIRTSQIRHLIEARLLVRNQESPM